MVRTPSSSVDGASLIPGQAAKIPHGLWPKNPNVKQKQCCFNTVEFNKDFKKNGPHQKILKKKKERKTPLWFYIHRTFKQQIIPNFLS